MTCDQLPPSELQARRSFLLAAGALALSACAPRALAQRQPTIDVKKLGASGTGKVSDLQAIRAAVDAAASVSGGATLYFPPGEYYLGTANDTLLVGLSRLQNIKVIGERATISCRSLKGSSSMFIVAGCRNLSFEGLTFRDYGLQRDINWLGAAAIRLANEGETSVEQIAIRGCQFDSVLSALVCRSFDERATCRGIHLEDLSVSRSYYGFSFQDAGDQVTGRNLRCNDVKRSYFPYGVADHDIQLDTSNNATGFTDVLIKCYHKDTTGLKVNVKCRAKRSGDAIIALDHQHEHGRGTMRDIAIDFDIDDADCQLDRAILIRSFTHDGRVERQTGNRWDRIALDGTARLCQKTRLLDIATTARTPGTLHIGPRLAADPRLPRTFPGFTVSMAR